MTTSMLNSAASDVAGAICQVRSAGSIVHSGNRQVKQKPGKKEVAIRVYFQVDGSGSFLAGEFDTSLGAGSAWLKPHAVIRLHAKPNPGHQFSHWMVQNEFAGSNHSRRVEASQGMVIRAVFVPLSADDIRC